MADEVTMARFGGDDPIFSNQYDLSKAEIRKHREILKQEFVELAADNPTLAKAIYERANLNLEYEKHCDASSRRTTKRINRVLAKPRFGP